MSNSSRPTKYSSTKPPAPKRKLPFTYGIEVENFITNKRGDILEDGKELVAVWDQMFNGALKFLKSLTSTSTTVPQYIRNKIKGVSRKDVKRHGKVIRYIQLIYQVNGRSIAINVFGPDPNISQITWLLELVTPPCESLAELDWWVKTLYLVASTSITKGYNIQPLGFNPYQREYRAGVTCGEHHHIGGFKNNREKKAAYNMIRAYIPHIIAIASTSPFVDGEPTGRILLKKSEDGRTLILAPDCVRSFRLQENTGQLGPNLPDYLPYVGSSFTQKQFSRYVRKEIPDDRYVDLYPFTTYGTVECRFMDAQYDQGIRNAIIVLIQALALKGVKIARAGKIIPEIRGNTIFEHRKRAINFGMFAKFQGDPSIESTGGVFAKYYNHNPADGGVPGKIFESLRALLIWLKPELKELQITEKDILPLLIMLWGTARIAPPISAATFMFYLYYKKRNVAHVISTLGLNNGYPGTIFSDILGRPEKSLEDLLGTTAAKPTKVRDHTRSTLARKLQQDSRQRRRKVRVKERTRLKAKIAKEAKAKREKLKREREIERKRRERLKLLEKAKKPPPKVTKRPSRTPPPSRAPKKAFSSSRSRTWKASTTTVSPRQKRSTKTTPRRKSPSMLKPPAKRKTTARTTTRTTKTKPKQRTSKTKKPVTKTPSRTKTKSKKPPAAKRSPPSKSVPSKRGGKSLTKTRKKSTSRSSPKKKVVIKKPALKKISRSSSSSSSRRRAVQAYASTASPSSSSRKRRTVLPPPRVSKKPTAAKTAISSSVRRTSSRNVPAVTKSVPVSRGVAVIQDFEFFKHPQYIKDISIQNLPNKVQYSIIVPAVKLKWKKSIIQSKNSLPVVVESELTPLFTKGRAKKSIYRESHLLEKQSLKNFCYLPIPIDLGTRKGTFNLKVTVKDGKGRKIFATAYQTFSRRAPPTSKKHSVTKIGIPRGQVGDSKVNIGIKLAKRNLKGKLTIFALSQRGIIKLYEKKAKIKTASFSLEAPVFIPPSSCSSKWYLFVLFNAKGSTVSAYTKASPPVSKIIYWGLYGDPALKSRINWYFKSELTPKIQFKVRCDLREVELFQTVDGKKTKSLKKYRLKTRIKKNEKFTLESFEWKAPSMRKGLFSSYKERTVSFHCKVTDNMGVINNSLIESRETPVVKVIKRR